MKQNNQFHISGGFVKIDQVNFYNNTDKQSYEKNEAEKQEEADDAEPVELVEVQPSDEHTFMDCIAEKETADILRKWLHQMMDPIPSKKPKEKLIYLRAVSEADAFIKKLPYKVYVQEFGTINKASYYYWMLRELYYDSNEIDRIVELFRQFLVQFRK